jgi:hypothetical protein
VVNSSNRSPTQLLVLSSRISFVELCSGERPDVDVDGVGNGTSDT